MSQAAAKPSALAKLRRPRKGLGVTSRGRLPVRMINSPEGRVSHPSKGMVKKIVYQKIVYEPGNVDEFVSRVASATPIQIVEIERAGVVGSFIKDLSKRIEIPSSRMFTMLGVPKSTAEFKAAGGKVIAGSGGQAAIGMVKLLGIAKEIVANSTATKAKGFDAFKWLGQWIERPQPSLGGRKPADLLDTPTGVEVVVRLLGSLESGAYQ